MKVGSSRRNKKESQFGERTWQIHQSDASGTQSFNNAKYHQLNFTDRGRGIINFAPELIRLNIAQIDLRKHWDELVLQL